MKSLRLIILAFAVLLSLYTFAQAQSDMKTAMNPEAKQEVKSDAQQSFDKLKTLAGSWQGPTTTIPPQAEMGDGSVTKVSLRVTSRGNSLVHEMTGQGNPDDPSHDHPVTMYYIDGDRLMLTHYCDAGNRPRMVGKMLPDGKTVEFDFLDVAGSTQYGHMHHAVFTIIDADHHTEDWTYMLPGDKPVRAHMDLQRAK
jgi:hypothetical protein